MDAFWLFGFESFVYVILEGYVTTNDKAKHEWKGGFVHSSGRSRMASRLLVEGLAV